jgi:hypothetical protein
MRKEFSQTFLLVLNLIITFSTYFATEKSKTPMYGKYIVKIVCIEIF